MHSSILDIKTGWRSLSFKPCSGTARTHTKYLSAHTVAYLPVRYELLVDRRRTGTSRRDESASWTSPHPPHGKKRTEHPHATVQSRALRCTIRPEKKRAPDIDTRSPRSPPTARHRRREWCATNNRYEPTEIVERSVFGPHTTRTVLGLVDYTVQALRYRAVTCSFKYSTVK
jgi:hypothetical protein